jgi:hypothetical protein
MVSMGGAFPGSAPSRPVPGVLRALTARGTIQARPSSPVHTASVLSEPGLSWLLPSESPGGTLAYTTPPWYSTLRLGGPTNIRHSTNAAM